MSLDIVLTETFQSSLDQREPAEARRILDKLKNIVDFPDHYLDRLRDHPGYKLRVGDLRVLIDWDKNDETIYAIDIFERKRNYRTLGTYSAVWGDWRDDFDE